MACYTRYMNNSPVHASTRHQQHVTSWDLTYLLVLLDAMDSNDSDDNELDGYVHLQSYTHSSINVHIQDKTTNDQHIIFNIVQFIQSRSHSLALQWIITSSHLALEGLTTQGLRSNHEFSLPSYPSRLLRVRQEICDKQSSGMVGTTLWAVQHCHNLNSCHIHCFWAWEWAQP